MAARTTNGAWRSPAATASGADRPEANLPYRDAGLYLGVR